MANVIVTTPDELKKLISEALQGLNIQPQPEQKDQIVNRSQLCEILGVTLPTIIRWEQKGKIPCFRIGSAVRYRLSAVLDALENKKGGKR